MARKWGETTQRILALLAEVGPMTRSEICRQLGYARQECAAIMTRLNSPTKRPPAPRRIHISGWVYDEEGQRRYPRAVYDLGDKPDAKQPKTAGEARKRYREARKLRVSSVFELGMSRAQRRSMGRGV